MSHFTGPGVYEIVPCLSTFVSFNLWGENKANNTPIKLYQRTSGDNTLWQFVSNGSGEYLILSVHSGLLLKANGNQSETVTASQVNPTDPEVRWKIVPAETYPGAFLINNVNGKTQLNVAGGNTSPGSKILAWPVENGTNSMFFLRLKGR